MKTAFLALCLLGATAAFGQHAAGGVSSQSHSYQSPSHPQHAAPHALAAEHYLLGGSNYSSVRGDTRTWDLAQEPTQSSTRSLGETARMLKTEHTKLKRARIVFEN